jgi:hypothetical protein
MQLLTYCADISSCFSLTSFTMLWNTTSIGLLLQPCLYFLLFLFTLSLPLFGRPLFFRYPFFCLSCEYRGWYYTVYWYCRPRQRVWGGGSRWIQYRMAYTWVHIKVNIQYCVQILSSGRTAFSTDNIGVPCKAGKHGFAGTENSDMEQFKDNPRQC